jgi:hypothetical protein
LAVASAPIRFPRFEEDDEATIDELAFAASCLAALAGNGYPEAAQALRDMTEKATRRRRSRGVA